MSGSEPVDTRKQPVLVVGDWTYYRSTRHGGEFAAYCTTDPYARALDNPHEVALLDEVLRLRARNEVLERVADALGEATRLWQPNRLYRNRDGSVTIDAGSGLLQALDDLLLP